VPPHCVLASRGDAVLAGFSGLMPGGGDPQVQSASQGARALSITGPPHPASPESSPEKVLETSGRAEADEAGGPRQSRAPRWV